MPRLGTTVGGGDSGEELDISLLHVRLYHETWQGMLQVLDDATLRANSAVPMAAVANTSTNTAEVDQHAALQQDVSTLPSDQKAPASSTTSFSEAGSNSVEQHSESKAEAVGNSMEVQLQQEARLQSGQQASTSAADTNQQQQVSAPQAEPSGATTLLGKNAEQGSVGAVARADMSQGARMHSQQLEGSWKVFDLAAVPIDETDVDTGDCCSALPRSRLRHEAKCDLRFFYLSLIGTLQPCIKCRCCIECHGAFCNIVVYHNQRELAIHKDDRWSGMCLNYLYTIHARFTTPVRHTNMPDIRRRNKAYKYACSS